ncbi:HAD family hydrolase [Bacillus sp. NEB1478]|uniref:HAD family hydrolase n=1 Tax=Bacillus sp. NEB1478 TaxID=3073816 RepID=UPI00287376CD|nr:HAD family hydrolase [Bacillus sp. NEB1478]WNB93542.1 HAD family hydrolase [Bacillus sp. NEB1478]
MRPVNNCAFFFDLDNTLFNYEASFKKASLFAFNSIFVPQLNQLVDLEKWFRSYKGFCDLYWSSYETNKITKEEYRRNRLIASFIALNLPISFKEDALLRYQSLVEESIPAFVEPYPWIGKIWNRLNESCSHVGVISNGGSKLQREKLKKLRLNLSTATIYISSEISLAKPSAEVFTYAASKCSAKNYYYCGDSYEFDILPAVQAGWTGIWWNPEKRKGHIMDKNIQICHTSENLWNTFMKYIE